MTTIDALALSGPMFPTAMTATRRRLIGALNITESGLALLVLVAAYGVAEHLVAAQNAAEPDTLATLMLHWWGPDFGVTLSMSLLIVGAAAAVAGSVVQECTVFAARAGHETLERGFIWWYLMRPVWSALLGAIAVISVNAGLISIGDEPTPTAGVTVLTTTGAITGLFTDQVLQRLKNIFGASDERQPATFGTSNSG